MTDLHRTWKQRIAVRACTWLAISALFVWALRWSEFSLGNLLESGPRFGEFFSRLVPPDWSVTQAVVTSTVETLMIALAGTGIAVLVALPLGFMAASNVSPSWLAQPIKWLLGAMRAVPLIVVAMLFVSAVGLGPFPGMLALAFHSIGMLGKFYAEEFETAEPGILNAVSGTGATWGQTLRYGLFPQSVPQVVAFTVYRLEMNFRDAAVLGLVGAGGVGYYIVLYVRGFQYERVAVLVMVIIAVVTLLDGLTFWVRRKVH
ncbi:MAG: phosphonate ABC transporter, permease protein PhnE [Acidobacteria bacterium]|nr:phosphonate ABC transporter, permease protein PhnE [Acidobacteriota bacterium]